MNYLEKALKAHNLFLFFIKKRQHELAGRAVNMRSRYFEAHEKQIAPWLFD